jgi:hypothetical protein
MAPSGWRREIRGRREGYSACLGRGKAEDRVCGEHAGLRRAGRSVVLDIGYIIYLTTRLLLVVTAVGIYHLSLQAPATCVAVALKRGAIAMGPSMLLGPPNLLTNGG